ncbi:MAG: methylmalonyl-CoA epimerase [Caldisericia bacterium]
MSGLSHIGVAVKDIEASKKTWETLGFVCEHEGVVEEQKVKVAKMVYNGLVVELLEPTSDDSPIAKYMEKKGQGIHHMCIEVADVPEKISEFQTKEIIMIDNGPRIGAAGKPIAFVHPKSTGGVLLELEQE